MLKINDVTVVKFAVDGKEVEKTVKVCSISTEDRKNRIRFMESENFRMETRLDEQERIVEEKWTENDVTGMRKFEYSDDGTVFEKAYDCDGKQLSEKITRRENGKEITKDQDGKETVIEVQENPDGTSLRRIGRSINSDVFETVEQHLDVNGKIVYSRTERTGNVKESWCEFDEAGYCILQKFSDGTEYRNVKSEDGRFVINYMKVNDADSIMGITEIIEDAETETRIHYHIA